jgi:eukaryotic-like serine/threonine-protein kinase
MSEQAGTERRVAGRYLLETVLGRGGMGTVWRARDELLGRPVAIKAVEIPEAVPDHERAAARARVLREARAAARLNHPLMVTTHDIVEDGGHLYIVMEVVAAPTLAAVVREHGPLPPARVARIGEQLLDALELAHAAGIVHRDVKPANVMLLARDHVRVADFGIASIQGDPQLTSSGMVLGSPPSWPPSRPAGSAAGRRWTSGRSARPCTTRWRAGCRSSGKGRRRCWPRSSRRTLTRCGSPVRWRRC